MVIDDIIQLEMRFLVIGISLGLIIDQPDQNILNQLIELLHDHQSNPPFIKVKSSIMALLIIYLKSNNLDMALKFQISLLH